MEAIVNLQADTLAHATATSRVNMMEDRLFGFPLSVVYIRASTNNSVWGDIQRGKLSPQLYSACRDGPLLAVWLSNLACPKVVPTTVVAHGNNTGADRL